MRPLAAAATLAIAAALSGCGGGSGGGGQNELTKAQFAGKANVICAKARAERQVIVAQLPPAPSGPADAARLDRINRIDNALIRNVDALVPPNSEQDSVDGMLDVWRRRISVENQLRDAVDRGSDPLTLQAFTTKVSQIDAQADPTARALGIDQCVRGTP